MNLIAAVDRNWAIGRNGKLLVSIPQDMAYFRQMTTGKVVIMGRKTLESFDTRDVFVIGGGEVYRSLLPYCDTAYITKIDFAYDADTRLPDLDHDPEWEKVRATDELTYFDLVYEFDTYRRK